MYYVHDVTVCTIYDNSMYHMTYVFKVFLSEKVLANKVCYNVVVSAAQLSGRAHVYHPDGMGSIPGTEGLFYHFFSCKLGV